jgi:hypothetical protein
MFTYLEVRFNVRYHGTAHCETNSPYLPLLYIGGACHEIFKVTSSNIHLIKQCCTPTLGLVVPYTPEAGQVSPEKQNIVIMKFLNVHFQSSSYVR